MILRALAALLLAALSVRAETGPCGKAFAAGRLDDARRACPASSAIGILLDGLAPAGAETGVPLYGARREKLGRFGPKAGADLLRPIAAITPVLAAGLKKSQYSPSLAEFDALNELDKDEAVVLLSYFNRYGEVRWSRDPTEITADFDDYVRRWPDVDVNRAYRARRAEATVLRDGALLRLVVPIIDDGAVIGTVHLLRSLGGPVALKPVPVKKARAKMGEATSRTPLTDALRVEQLWLDALIYDKRGDKEKAAAAAGECLRFEPAHADCAGLLRRLKP